MTRRVGLKIELPSKDTSKRDFSAAQADRSQEVNGKARHRSASLEMTAYINIKRRDFIA
jgi:hypothetical protein